MKQLPFAAMRPYIYILKSKGGQGFIKDMYTDYTSANYDKDFPILESIWMKEAPKKNIFISYDYEEEYEHTTKQIDKYKEFIEDIENSEDKEKETFDLDKFKNKLKFWQEKKVDLEESRVSQIKTKIWKELVQHALDNAKEKNPVMSFWNLSRIMAMRLSGDSKGNKMSIKWNWLLRQCGYTGFSDIQNRGYIHPSEPMQTVFLSKDAFTVVDRIMNKNYDNVRIDSLSSINNYITRGEGKFYISIILQFLLTGLTEHFKKHVHISKSKEYMLETASFNDFYTFIKMACSYAQSGYAEKVYTTKKIKEVFELYLKYHDLGVSEIVLIKDLIKEISN